MARFPFQWDCGDEKRVIVLFLKIRQFADHLTHGDIAAADGDVQVVGIAEVE